MIRLPIFVVFLLGSFASAQILPQLETLESVTEGNMVQGLDDDCSADNQHFQSGEELKYKIYYNWRAVWVYAGYANFTLTDEQLEDLPVYHAVCVGKTARKFNLFYKVNDRYETYMDKQSLRPVQFIRDIKEGGFAKQTHYSFFQNENRVHVHHIIRQGKLKTKNKDVNVGQCIHDLVSAVYNTRCTNYDNLEVGDKVPVELFLDGEVYSVHLKYMGKGVLETDLGKFNCVKVSPMLLKGDVFEGNEEMIIWATDDENRLPLLIESPLSVGHAKAYLTSYKGLRNPLTAKID